MKKLGETPDEATQQAELIVSVCERYMAQHVEESGPLKLLKTQAAALFPPSSVDRPQPNVLDRLARVEQQLTEILSRIELF